MFDLQNVPCEFTQYAHGLNLSSAKDQKDLAAALDKSFMFISNLAADKQCIYGNAADKLQGIVFYPKTHTFASQPTTSGLSALLPSKIWTLLGYEEEAAGPKNLEGMMLFIAEKLSKLAKLKFGCDDDDTFAKYLLLNYTGIHMGITYLKEYYRRFVPPTSKEESEEKTLERCLSIHEAVTASSALIAGYSSDEIFTLSNSFLNVSKAEDLLSLEINAPIKNMMLLGKKLYNEAYIKEFFKGGKHNKFMVSCLKIDAELFPQILAPLSKTLEKAYENQYSSSNLHLQEFYVQILNSEYFKDLHIDVVALLLEKKKWNESEEEFQMRSQSSFVKKALSYIVQKIKQIKQQPIPKKKQKVQLSELLKIVDNQLRTFPPFKQIFNFVLVYSDQTPAENNPGLPFKAFGGYEVSNFITQVFLSFDDLDLINLSDSACRKKLLQCAESIIVTKFSEALQSINGKSPVDLNKLDRWLSLFPEIAQLPCWFLIEKFYQAHNLELPVQLLSVNQMKNGDR